MDPSRYKTVKTKRGFTYNYYASSSQEGKLTLLFLHGYPTTSGDWAAFVAFFEQRGYGTIVPDLLGFGETDKPTDAKSYVGSGLVNDVVDILDAENVDKVVVIGHDWGVKLESRIATYRPERVIGYVFVCLSYLPRKTFSHYEEFIKQCTALLGYNPFGYWLFFASDSDLTIRTHIDAFVSVVFPLDPKIWLTKLAPVGALESALRDDFHSPLPPHITEEYIEKWKRSYLANGFTAPNQWYNVVISGAEAEDEDNTTISADQEFPPKSAPIFFAAAEEDYICAPKLADSVWDLPQFKDHRITKKSYAADHWVVLSKAEQMCADLEEWLGQISSGST